MDEVFDDIIIKDFVFDFITVEDDILSLELGYSFKDFYLGNDLSMAK